MIKFDLFSHILYEIIFKASLMMLYMQATMLFGPNITII